MTTTPKTPSETTVLGPYPNLEQNDLFLILSFTRSVGRQARFARLSNGTVTVYSTYEGDPGGSMATMAAGQFKTRHPTATDAVALAYGQDYARAAMGLYALYRGAGPGDTDPTIAASKNAASDAALAQLDALGSVA